jgi:hypothetical protein
MRRPGLRPPRAMLFRTRVSVGPCNRSVGAERCAQYDCPPNVRSSATCGSRSACRRGRVGTGHAARDGKGGAPRRAGSVPSKPRSSSSLSATRRGRAVACKTSSSVLSWAGPMCSTSRDPRREECTICRAVAPTRFSPAEGMGTRASSTGPDNCADPLTTICKRVSQLAARAPGRRACHKLGHFVAQNLDIEKVRSR